jgi:hypothetical protein
MVRTRFVVPASLLALAAAATIVLALGADHPADQPVGGSSDWPPAFLDLVNSKGRVGGYFVNQFDSLFFQGDPKAFSAWLQQYAALADTPLRLVLHPGRGNDGRPWSKPDEKRLPVDWRIDINNRQWTREAMVEKKPVKPGYDVTVHVFLGGQVGLEDLDVPLGVSVESGGEIEEFIAHHQAKQSLTKKEAK